MAATWCGSTAGCRATPVPDTPTVDGVNLRARLALISDGTTRPITNMLDVDGDETDDPADAVSVVCGGPDAAGRDCWWALDLADYDVVTEVH